MNRRDLLKRLPVAAAAVTAAACSQPEPENKPDTKLILEMDGRELAEFILPHLSGAVRRYGLS